MGFCSKMIQSSQDVAYNRNSGAFTALKTFLPSKSSSKVANFKHSSTPENYS